jgi:flagellar P-ring protein precursor FlgI
MKLALFLLLSLPGARAESTTAGTRLKQLISIEGVRDNPLVGYGLVVGLAGTGDRRQTVFSAQSLANMLERMGVSTPGASIRVNNTAGVIATATLPPFAQPGSRLDVTLSAIGDASNLQGGVLVLTSLRGADGQVYAVAQGPVVTGGFAAGRGGSGSSVNHPTVGRAPEAAIVERAAPTPPPRSTIRLQMRQSDFTTSARIVEVINRKFGVPGSRTARAENSGLIQVAIPPEYATRPIEFVAELEGLEVQPDRAARVVVNERTGTIVLGRDVRIAPVAILHGNLSVEIQTSYAVSQPTPLSKGSTEVTPQTTVGVKEEKARNVVLKQGATIEDLVKGLAAIGSTPRDIIAILQNLKRAGALDAELEII